MGVLISRFRRHKSTRQTLEELENKMKRLQQFLDNTQRQKRRVVGNLLVISVGLYVLAILLFYFFFHSKNYMETILYSSPLLVSPLVIIFLRRGLTKYYDWRIQNNRVSLSDMGKEKERILEEVMEKETYKVAKEILDKFSDKPEFPSPPPQRTSIAPAVTSQASTPAQLRQRQVGPAGRPLLALQGAPMGGALLGAAPSSGAPSPITALASPAQMTALKSDQLPRPILSGTATTGSAFDRLVDFLVGDGPGSRYALICCKCKGHNGMSLPEEFEYVSYRCAYCRFPNPARKQRPKAPTLMSTPLKAQSKGSPSSDSSDSEDEKQSNKDTRRAMLRPIIPSAPPAAPAPPGFRPDLLAPVSQSQREAASPNNTGPALNNTSPASNNASPAFNNTSPASNNASPAFNNTSPASNNASPAFDNASSTSSSSSDDEETKDSKTENIPEDNASHKELNIKQD